MTTQVHPSAAMRRPYATALFAGVLFAGVLLAGCAMPAGDSTPAPAAAPAAAVTTAAAPAVVPAAPPAPPAPAAPATPPPPPPPVLPFEEAVLSAANNLLGKAQLAGDVPRHTIVIDPLIDGVTGAQTNASRAMGQRIVELIRERYPQYEVQPFSAANVAKSPLVLVGTLTGVNAERKTEGDREAYRICLALADLKTGKLVGKGLAFARMDGVDPAPTAFFRDAPAWAEDPATLGYIRTCQGTRAGDPIHPLYVDRITTGALISEAIDAYGAGRYREALGLYETALGAPAGKQLRVYSGLYLTNWRLGRRDAAAQAFGQIVDQGLDSKRLGVKFLFRPGSTAFWSEPGPAATPYDLWLKALASQASQRQSCLEVVGHSSATGPAALNERLSLLRAEYVRDQLVRTAPALGRRTIANGAGSRETMVGNKRDDASDALDRRVEFKVIGC
jgi:outer membrane protein OmpA-like peptidoglycan-associated protein